MTSIETADPQKRQSDIEHPVYFAGGFGYGAARNARALAHIAELGYATTPVLPDPDIQKADTTFQVVSAGAAARLSMRQAMRVAHKQEVELSVSNYQDGRADELITMLEKGGYNGVNAIFQSADALNGLLALHKRPDMFGNVILAYPAGLVRQPRPARASLGVLRSVASGMLRKYVVPVDNSFEKLTGRFTSRPKTAGGFVTAASVALSSQSALLSAARQRPDAPGVSLVLGLGDWMIRPKRVLDGLNAAHDIDYILVTNTPHGIKGRKDVMQKALGLFSLMERSGLHDGTLPLADRMVFMQDVPASKQDELREIAAKVTAAY
jgi:hypothetical protein